MLDNLFYANGVALAADESFVLVAEFLAFRIVRRWLTGPRAGSHEIFVDGLPGYPDNITRTPDGHFLVGLSLQRIPGLDAQRARPWAVKVLYRLPAFLKPKAQYPGYLMEFDAQGRLRRFVADETRGRGGAGDLRHGPAGPASRVQRPRSSWAACWSSPCASCACNRRTSGPAARSASGRADARGA